MSEELLMIMSMTKLTLHHKSGHQDQRKGRQEKELRVSFNDQRLKIQKQNNQIQELQNGKI